MFANAQTIERDGAMLRPNRDGNGRPSNSLPAIVAYVRAQEPTTGSEGSGLCSDNYQSREPQMTTSTRWIAPLALLGGAAVGVALFVGRRRKRAAADNRHDRQALQDWEGEGGSLANPAGVRQPS